MKWLATFLLSAGCAATTPPGSPTSPSTAATPPSPPVAIRWPTGCVVPVRERLVSQDLALELRYAIRVEGSPEGSVLHMDGVEVITVQGRKLPPEQVEGASAQVDTPSVQIGPDGTAHVVDLEGFLERSTRRLPTPEIADEMLALLSRPAVLRSADYRTAERARVWGTFWHGAPLPSAGEATTHVAVMPGIEAPDMPLRFTIQRMDDQRFVAEITASEGQPEVEAVAAAHRTALGPGSSVRLRVVRFTERHEAELDLVRGRLVTSKHDVRVDLESGPHAKAMIRSREVQLDWPGSRGCDDP